MKLPSVMIVDDNEDDRYILRRLIKKANLATTIYEFADGKAGLDFLTDYTARAKQSPDDYPPPLIFLDINMPVMNGFEFLAAFQELREAQPGLEVCVLTMLTSSDNGGDQERTSAYPFVKGYVIKMPATTAELLEMVQAALD